jgi:hypothetical protein
MLQSWMRARFCHYLAERLLKVPGGLRVGEGGGTQRRGLLSASLCGTAGPVTSVAFGGGAVWGREWE